MTTQTIEVEGLPEGCKALEIQIDPDQHYQYVGDDGCLYWQAKIKMEKIQPRMIVLEETGEERSVKEDEWYEDSSGKFGKWWGSASVCKFKIWREVKETDIPLNSEEPKLSLSVDQCKELLGVTAHRNDTADILEEFIKENS